MCRVVFSAPGRAGVVGNPSDMYGGSVISCSIRERAYVSVEPSDRLLLESDEGLIEIRSRADLQMRGDHCDILRAVVTHAYSPDLRCHMRCWSEIPFGAGLSGSTAMVVAALAALFHFRGQHPNTYHFAELARSIELNHLKVVCGYQDQYMATFGGLNYLDFRDKEFYREVFSEPFASVESLLPYCAGLPPVILAHTGVEHNSGAVHKPIRERWLDGERTVVEAYVRVARLAREAKKALLAADWDRLAALMTENHAIQRALGGSGPENEGLIEAALNAGALAAKLAGAGSGGTIIALHPQAERLVQPMLDAGAERILYLSPQEGVRREPDPKD